MLQVQPLVLVPRVDLVDHQLALQFALAHPVPDLLGSFPDEPHATTP
jgi:hypothetical protein